MMQWLTERDPEASFEEYRRRCENQLLQYLEGPSPKPERGKRP